MAKRKETLAIEKLLHEKVKDEGIYGCHEITIGFSNKGYGNEIVDFMTMDSKGILRCYEIKVTISDFKSKAKKSFYGHYNYYVMPRDLAAEIIERGLIDEEIGIYEVPGNYYKINCIKKPKKQDISKEQSEMLKESMVRSIFYKMVKSQNANNLEKQKKINNELNKYKKLYKNEQQKNNRLNNEIFMVSSMFQEAETETGRISTRRLWENLVDRAKLSLTN